MPGKGPTVVITDLAVYTFDEGSGEMTLVELHPGVHINEVRENLGWDIQISPNLTETQSPTEEELRIIREELDPEHIYIR